MEPVLIAGAGIGGLALAAGLARRGIPALVVEQADRLAPVGAGLTVQPNAVLALRRLELSKPLESVGVPLTAAGIYDAGGRALTRQTVQDTPVAAIRRDDISDRPPVSQWGTGRTTLIGDAAHPMTPNLGQGACQAIEDALALTDFISQYGAEPDALRRYERFRCSRANAVVRASRQAGRVASGEGPARTRARNALVRLVPAAAMARQLRSSWALPSATSG